MCNKRQTVFYTGFTNDLEQRVWQHKTKFRKESFTSKYNVDQLVYFEEHSVLEIAQRREKTIKKWRREWKLNLIKSINPEFDDLAKEWFN